MTRPWEPREQRMTIDYILEKYPGIHAETRVGLGALPELPKRLKDRGISPRIMRGYQHWADGLIYLPDKTILIEAEILASRDGLGSLILYKQEYYKTARLRPRFSLPLVLREVYAYPDPPVIEAFRALGFETEQYRPEYIRKYYEEELVR